jgi:hypothetical protein
MRWGRGVGSLRHPRQRGVGCGCGGFQLGILLVMVLGSSSPATLLHTSCKVRLMLGASSC